MNTKKLLALVLALALLVCALPVVYAAVSDPADEEDTDISVDVEDLPDVSVVYGDVNGDGAVEPIDATLILQYCANWDVTLDAAAADVNADGAIEPIDATLVLQYCANWDVVLGPQ